MTLLTLAVVLALGSIGIDLTAFAVFSGAIGVGVGFGLQKVVSNLVSGVILLMDRSIKPGDVIEIDGTYGSVDRAECALCVGADARWQGVSDPERGPDHRARHQLVVLQRPDPPARESRDLVSGGSARGDPPGARGDARGAARADRASAELPAGRIRRQHDQPGIALLDQRSGERHRERAQRGDAEAVGPVSRSTASSCRTRSATSRCATRTRWSVRFRRGTPRPRASLPCVTQQEGTSWSSFQSIPNAWIRTRTSSSG